MKFDDLLKFYETFGSKYYNVCIIAIVQSCEILAFGPSDSGFEFGKGNNIIKLYSHLYRFYDKKDWTSQIQI